MDRFSRLNPKVTLLFFIAQIAVTIIIFNPALLGISFLSACVYKIVLNGKKGVKYILSFALPLMLVVALFNFIFTHRGATVLFVIAEMNFTLESLLYGFTQGLMLSSALLWFSVYSRVITSEHFLSVFGRFAPNLALIFSMVLSFIPRFRKNAQEISDARMNTDTEKSKFKKSINNFSALITMTLEESIDTADSMKARGFGKNRTVYSKYRFSSRDFCALLFIIATLSAIIYFKISGGYYFLFDPEIVFTAPPVSAITVYSLLALLPVITDAWEEVKWYFLKRKI